MRADGKKKEGEKTVSLPFNGKFNKIITLILSGILILIVLVPMKETGGENSVSSTETVVDEDYGELNSYADYYENKLKNILENSYGDGTMEVMVHVTEATQESSFYGEEKSSMVVDGVLVVADVKSEQAIADITYAVCALFDLPAHKVAVMIKN